MSSSSGDVASSSSSSSSLTFEVALLSTYGSASSRLLMSIPTTFSVAQLKDHAREHHAADLRAAKLIYHGHLLTDQQILKDVFIASSSAQQTEEKPVHTILVWTPTPPSVASIVPVPEVATTTTTPQTSASFVPVNSISPSPALSIPSPQQAATTHQHMPSEFDYWMQYSEMGMAHEFWQAYYSGYGYGAGAFHVPVGAAAIQPGTSAMFSPEYLQAQAQAQAQAHALAHAQAQAVVHQANQEGSHPVQAQAQGQAHVPAQAQGQAQANANANAGAAPVHVPPEAAAAAANGEAAQENRFWALIDLRLAVKLVFMVLLLGQDGDSGRFFTLVAVAVAVYLYQVGVLFGNRNERAGQPAQQRAQPPAAQRNQQAEAAEGAQQPQGSDGAGEAPVRRRRGPTGRMAAVEKFVIGLFASLHPGWTPPPQRPAAPAEHHQHDQ